MEPARPRTTSRAGSARRPTLLRLRAAAHERDQRRYAQAIAFVLAAVDEQLDEPTLLLAREPRGAEREARTRAGDRDVAGREERAELEPDPGGVDRVAD